MGIEAPLNSAELPSSSQEQGIGNEVRTLRKLRQKTLKGLALETGLSIGYLSQIERNKSSPSVNALHTISRALGVNITWFFGGVGANEQQQYVTRARRRKELRYESGITDFLLSQRTNSELELLWCRFEPGSTSGDQPYSHDGEEAGVVVTGEFALCLDGRWHLLEAGDSFAFPSHIPHRYKNPGRKTTELVWAITPPTY